MKTHMFFPFLTLVLVGVVATAVLDYGQPMDWGQKGSGPQRRGTKLNDLLTASFQSKWDGVHYVGKLLFGPVKAVEVQGDYAYLNSGGGILVLDISDSTSPTRIGGISAPGRVNGLFLKDSCLYVATGSADGDCASLALVNVSDPAYPYLEGQYNFYTSYGAEDVYVTGPYAYVAFGSGLRIINVANPANLYEVGYYANPVAAVHVLDSLVYAACGSSLRIINVADPASPYEVGYCDTPGGAEGLYVLDSLAYVASYYAGLRVINVADPTNPYELGYYDTPGQACGVYVSGSYAYVADGTAGLRVINVSNPANPYEEGYYDTPGSGGDVYVSGSYAYVGGSGLRVISVADPANPYEEGYYPTPGEARGVYVTDSHAYVADGSRGLMVISVVDPTNPREEGYCITPGSAHDVYADGFYAYLADGESGLRIINVADPANPYEVGHYDTPGYARSVYVLGSYAYVADDTAGLRVINVADPANPYEVGHCETPGSAQDVYVLDSLAYVADDARGLRIINVAYPANPNEVGYYDTPAHAVGVCVLGSYAYIADMPFGEEEDGLRVIDVANPTDPHEVGYYDTGYAHDVYVSGSYAYVAENNYGLGVINVVDPTNPYEAGSFDNPWGWAWGLSVANSVYPSGCYTYFTDAMTGLIIVQFSGQLGTIAGTVKDSYTQNPIEGVLVEAMQEENVLGSDNTESDGSYSIPNLPPGTYNVRASKDGYETKTENGKEVVADQTTTVDFQLNPSPSDTLFFDDFADGNDDGWQKYGGCTWTVENEEYTSSVSGSEVWCLSVAGNSDWTDYIFEADVYGDAGVDKVVAFRVVDENNFYAVNVRSDWMGADEVTLSRIVNGVSTEITTAEYPSQLNTWYHIQVKVIGDNIKVRVDDNLVIDYTDTDTPLDNGQIAVTAYSGAYGSATVRFDNVLVAWPPGIEGIQVLSPNGGEEWVVGSEHDITWTSMNFTGNVKIEYSTNGGTDWMPIISSTENDGIHLWTIPDDPSTDCLVKVSDAADGNPWDVSDAPFTISPHPTGTIAGTVTEIRLPPAPPIPDVLIEVWQGFTIVNSTTTSDDGTYTLEVNTGTYLVKASKLGYVTKTQDNVVVTEDQTTTIDFQLPRTNITLTSPENGDVWIGGDTYLITWTTEGTGIDHIRLDYTTDGSNWESIVESTPDNGSFSWETPRIGCRTVVVRAYAEAVDDHIWDWDEHMFTLGFGDFLLNRDAYGFDNYGDPDRDDDWDQFVDAFNLQGLIDHYPGATISKILLSAFLEGRDGNKAGNCFGMSATSILFFTRFLDVTDQNLVGQEADSPYELQLYQQGHIIPELDHLIEKYHWYAMSAEVQKYLWKSDDNEDPVTVFNRLLDNFQNGNERPSTIQIAKARVENGEIKGPAHAMVAIGAYLETSTIGKIVAYDPDAPGVQGREVTVDLAGNTWGYPPRGWSGDSDVRSLFAVPDTILDGPHSLPEEDPDLTVVLAVLGAESVVRLFFTDDQGRYLGWHEGNFHANIPGAGPILFWESDTGPSPEQYFLPSDIYFTTTVIGVDTGTYGIDFFAGGNLFQIRDATVGTTTIDHVSYVDSTGTASYTTSDSMKWYSSSLIKVLPDTSGERIFTVLNTSISAGDSVNFVVSPDLNSFSYVNWGGPKTYDLMIEQRGIHGDSTFYSGFSLGESTTDRFTPQDWDSLSGSQVVLEVDVGNDGNVDSTIVLEPGVSVPSRHLSGLPMVFSLSQNYPNPFNPITTIKYALPRDCWVRLEVYNILGQKVASLVDGEQRAGYKTVRWDAGALSSGIYFYQLQAGEFVQTRKMVLLR